MTMPRKNEGRYTRTPEMLKLKAMAAELKSADSADPSAKYLVNKGQILYFVPSSRPGTGSPRELRVTNVGRKWATLETLPTPIGTTVAGEGFLSPSREFGRCDMTTGWVDGKGYNSPGRCWPSEQAYKYHVDITEAWSAYRLRVMGLSQPPPGLQLFEIQAMLAKL
jgi:hypothetical protein